MSVRRGPAGRTITITKHGQPVARLVPVRPQNDDARTTIEAIRAARRGTTLGEDTIRGLIEEGRR